jgi:hypothetical protein
MAKRGSLAGEGSIEGDGGVVGLIGTYLGPEAQVLQSRRTCRDGRTRAPGMRSIATRGVRDRGPCADRLSLIPVLLGWPMLLHPIHVAFLELVIDPACSIAFEAEPEEPGIMQGPPRSRDTPLFTSRMLVLSLLQGASVLAVSLALYLIAGGNGDAHTPHDGVHEPHVREYRVDHGQSSVGGDGVLTRKPAQPHCRAGHRRCAGLAVTIVSVAPLRALFAFSALADGSSASRS